MKVRTIRPRTHLARRAWTDRERSIVWRGLTGRMAIAIEPLLGTVFFSLLAVGIVWRSHIAKPHDLWILSPIFGVAALAFLFYFIAVLFAPVTAYFQTRKPIYQLDGYIRYRGPDGNSDLGSSGYVAVLFEDQALCCEWECYGTKPLPELTIAAMTEFSEYGGIHRIDGKSTGVLPDAPMPLLAIGIAPRK